MESPQIKNNKTQKIRAVDSGFSNETQSFSTNLLSNQLWTGLLVITLVIAMIGRGLRYYDGIKSTPIALLIQIFLYSSIFTGLYLRKTKYADLTKTIYLMIMQIQVPFSLILFGGTQGYGDISFFWSILLAGLFGWRRWMFVTFTINTLALFFVLYQEAIGQPVAPFVNAGIAPLSSAIKFSLFSFVMTLSLIYANRFYRRLLVRYREFGNEQVRLNQELETNETALQNVMGDLRQSRQKIVTAREEERRRIRRDLHDGLGPTLAAQVFLVGATRQLLPTNLEKADHLLIKLENGIEETLADVRRLVYDLRPPLLDQLKLIGAIRDFVRQYNTSFEINLDLPDKIPQISAAAEVAAFRVVQTALDNVAQHAQARCCQVIIKVTGDMMNIEIIDDGQGIEPDYQAGVGLTSMRERADELGGAFSIISNQPQGTHLFITLPIGTSS